MTPRHRPDSKVPDCFFLNHPDDPTMQPATTTAPLALAALVATAPLPAQDQPASVPPTVADLQYAKHKSCTLDFWKAGGDGPRPLHVHIHGGGWTGGDKKSGRGQARTFLDKGISYASINYRLSGEAPLPAPVHDAAYAIQFLRSKASAWNINPDRIALSGGSAGACTSMWILFHDDLADPHSDDPVKRFSTRVTAAAVSGGQVSIDPHRSRSGSGTASSSTA